MENWSSREVEAVAEKVDKVHFIVTVWYSPSPLDGSGVLLRHAAGIGWVLSSFPHVICLKSSGK